MCLFKVSLVLHRIGDMLVMEGMHEALCDPAGEIRHRRPWLPRSRSRKSRGEEGWEAGERERRGWRGRDRSGAEKGAGSRGREEGREEERGERREGRMEGG